jgi:hypothetical protein
MPDSDMSIIESSKDFFTERVPDKGGTSSGFRFFGFSGRAFFSDGINSQVNNRFFEVTS